MLSPASKELVKDFPLKDRPTKVELDPRNTILKEVTAKP
jgi:hypothetical protein